jgi:hypothetical protein
VTSVNVRDNIEGQNLWTGRNAAPEIRNRIQTLVHIPIWTQIWRLAGDAVSAAVAP